MIDEGAIDAHRTGRRKRAGSIANHWTGFLFVAPAVAFVAVFFLIPLGMTGWISLHNWPLLGHARFIGLRNYIIMWRDARFWNALGFTFEYTIVVTIAIFAVAFPLALFVERPKPFVGFYRTAFFLPWVVGFASSALLWVWLLNVDSGLISPAARALGLVAHAQPLLAAFGTGFTWIVIMVVWKVAGFTMVILLTGLQAIPDEIKEAATIDGAGPLARFRLITLPLMRRTIALALVISVSGSILAFDQFYIMTNGGPQNRTITAVYYIFNTSFVSFHLGYGAAMSIVLLVILVTISIVQMRLLRDPEGL